MRILVLGGAAGGGFPQWNCRCANCQRARNGDPFAKARTQCSVAVSANGRDWLLLEASPDLRQQIIREPLLRPGEGRRNSPVKSAILSSGEVDAVVGLLHLREGQPLSVYATRRVHGLLDANPIFRALDPAVVARREIILGQAEGASDFGERSLGLSIEAFPVPGKIALYAEDEAQADFGGSEGDVVGITVRAAADGACFHFVPGCAALSADLRARLEGSALLFFDGTLWTDDEMIRLGLGTKTGARMGHLSVSGRDGSLAGLAEAGIARKVFIHVNNSNPMILEDSPERAKAEAAGWEVAYDGMEIEL
ncbi:MAG: pyrroloquinoline quinone biosynthesis protein PqqB [Acetobacteraceae bacterium]